MPWNSQGGGDKGPWGNSGGPKRYSSGGNKNQPDLEDLLRKGQEQFRKMIPKGWGGFSTFLGLFAVVVTLWMLTGFYRVDEKEQAAVLRFGKWTATTGPGLQYHLPYPIEQVVIKKVNEIRNMSVGGSGVLKDGMKESLMLTGDENIIDLTFVVQWDIKDLGQYLFNARSPDETVQLAAESVVREVVAQTPIVDVMTKERGAIDEKARELLQAILDEYKLGIRIYGVILQDANPPPSVVESFRDVQRAQTDKERKIQEAIAYENDIVPKAKGDAIKLVQMAEGDKALTIAKAEGEATRFLSVLKEYKLAPDVTRRQMYFKTMQEVFSKANKVIIDRKAQNTQGVLPYLPLPELQKRNVKAD